MGVFKLEQLSITHSMVQLSVLNSTLRGDSLASDSKASKDNSLIIDYCVFMLYAGRDSRSASS